MFSAGDLFARYVFLPKSGPVPDHGVGVPSAWDDLDKAFRDASKAIE
jgi:hypothetical protein